MAEKEFKAYSATVHSTCKKRIYTVNFPSLGKKPKNKHNVNKEESNQNNDIDVNVDNLNILCTQSKSKLEVKIIIETTTHMLDYYFRLLKKIDEKKIPNPMFLKLFGNNHPTKEIIETTTAFYNIKKYIISNTDSHITVNKIIHDKNILCICVGDGIGPATGYLMAAATDWNVLSIDPVMRDEWLVDSKISNLTCIKSKMEDVCLEKYIDVKICFIISVHGHADLNALWMRMSKNTRIIALSIPCCTGFEHYVKNVKPVIKYDENEIPSDKRTLLIWDTALESSRKFISDVGTS